VFNTLFFKIFAGFWLILAVMLMFVVLLPQLDERGPRPLPASLAERLQSGCQRLQEREPAEMHHRFHGNMRQGAQLFLINANGVDQHGQYPPRPVALFLGAADADAPLHSRRYGAALVAGPVVLRQGEQTYQCVALLQSPEAAQPWLQTLIAHPGWLLLMALAISTPLCLLLALHLTRPLRRLEQASARIAAGELDTPLQLPRRRDEIGQLGQSFARMVTSVKGMIEQQQRLLSDISHELRSPLTRLRMALAIARRKGQQSSELDRIETEAQRLEEMIAALLGLSRAQLQQQPLAEISLDTLLAQVLEDGQFEAQQLGKQLLAGELPPLTLHCYPDLLASAVENVVRNALRHAHSKVEVRATRHDARLRLTVLDDGPGVPAEQLEQIFRPFYRTSEARDRRSGGVGLGLAIALNAVQKHQGTLHADNRDPHGLAVTIELPL